MTWRFFSALVGLVAAGCGVQQDFGSVPVGAPDAGTMGESDAGPGKPPSLEWSERALLSMDHAQRAAGFGGVLARTATRVVVGAPAEGTALGPSVGAAYVFEREGDRWVRGQRLQAPAPAAYASFGSRVAVHDDLIVACGTRDRDGEVHVFARRDGFWTEVAAIPSPFPGNKGLCSGLVLTADTLAVGSAGGLSLYARTSETFRYVRTVPGDGNNYPAVAGSDQVIAVVTSGVSGSTAYAITAKSGVWSAPIEIVQESRIGSLAVDGTRVAIGQPCGGSGCSGRVTLYELASGGPVEVAQIVGPANRYDFGSTLSLHGGRLATDGVVMVESAGWMEESLVLGSADAGADFDVRGQRPISIALGADDVFFGVDEAVVRAKLGEPDRKAQLRSLQRLTASESTANPGSKSFGNRVSVGGDVAVVEAGQIAKAPVPSPGSSVAYIFERRFGAWRFKQTLPGYGPCAVGADGATVACHSSSGGVEVLARGAPGLWQSAQRVAESKRVTALALEGDRLAVGTETHASEREFGLEIYERAAGTWSLVHRSTEGSSNEIRHLAIGPALVAMARHSWEQTIAGGSVSGPPDTIRALVRSSAGTWSDATTVATGDASDPRSLDRFVDVAVSGDRIVFLRSFHMNVTGPAPSQSIRTLEEYAMNDASWVRSARLTLDVPRLSSVTSLAHDGSEWLVGAPGDGTGSMTIVTRTETGFVAGPKWTDPQAIGGADFAYSVAAGGAARVVGEPGQSRVHVFERAAAKPIP